MATVDLAWTDNSSSEDGFYIYRTTTSSPTFPDDYTQIDSVGADVTSYTDSNSPDDETVTYAVTAYNSDGESSETTGSIGTPVTGSASLAGSATVSAVGTETTVKTASLSASASMTATGAQNIAGSASLSGGASASTSGTEVSTASISSTGSASTAATGTKTSVVSVSPTGTSTFAAGGTEVYNQTATLNGTASVTASAVESAPATGSASLSASASLSSTATKTATAAAGLSASGNLTSDGTVVSAPTATLAGSASLAPNATAVHTSNSSLSGSANLTTTPTSVSLGTTAFSGDATATATGILSHTGDAAIVGVGSVSPVGTAVSTVDTVFSGSATVSATAYPVSAGAATMSGTAFVDATGSIGSVFATTELPNEDVPIPGNGVEDEVSVDREGSVSDYGDVRVQIRESSASSWDSSATGFDEVVIDHATTSTTFGSREDGEEYEVRARTETEHVTGAWTDPVAITTKFPGATSLTVDAVGDTTVDLSWNDNSDNEDGFKIYRAREYDDGFHGFYEEFDLPPNTTAHTDDSVSPGNTYEWFVRAYTDDTSADSGTVQTTTNDLGIPRREIEAQGWYAEVERPDGPDISPNIVGDPQWIPGLNQLPEVRIPVEKKDAWLDSKYEGQPMEVYNDGQRLPIDELKDVKVQPNQVMLIGQGGLELMADVSVTYTEKEAHLAAESLITNNTSYTANVDSPSTSSNSDALQQSVSTTSEWEDALAVAYSDSDVVDVEGGKLVSKQTAYFVEAENADTTTVGDSFYNSGSAYSNGEVFRVQDPEVNNSWATVEHTWSVDHTIPSGSYSVYFRTQQPNAGNHGFNIYLDGTLIAERPADALANNESSADWSNVGSSSADIGDLAEGSHTVTIEFDEYSADDGTVYIDALAFVDTREPPNFTETVNSDVIEGPDLHPTGKVAETTDVKTGQQVTGGKLESGWNTTSGSQEVAISNDQGTNWLTSSGETVSGDFSGETTNIRARFTFGGYDSDSSASPKGRKTGHTVDLYDLYADLKDTPTLVGKFYENNLINILQKIADYGGFIFEIQYSEASGYTVEWTQVGIRSSERSEAVIDYEFEKGTKDRYEKVVVSGSARTVDGQTFTADHGTLNGLGNEPIVEGVETVYDSSQTYTRGTDYVMDYGLGAIETLSGGNMTDGSDYQIDYEWKPRGSYEVGDASTTPKTLFETFPTATSDTQAEQIAVNLAKEVNEAQRKAQVSVRNINPSVSLVDALSLDGLPFNTGMKTVSITHSPSQVELEMGERQPIERSIRQIRKRLQDTSEKV